MGVWLCRFSNAVTARCPNERNAACSTGLAANVSLLGAWATSAAAAPRPHSPTVDELLTEISLFRCFYGQFQGFG